MKDQCGGDSLCDFDEDEDGFVNYITALSLSKSGKVDSDFTVEKSGDKEVVKVADGAAEELVKHSGQKLTKFTASKAKEYFKQFTEANYFQTVTAADFRPKIK